MNPACLLPFQAADPVLRCLAAPSTYPGVGGNSVACPEEMQYKCCRYFQLYGKARQCCLFIPNWKVNSFGEVFREIFKCFEVCLCVLEEEGEK